MTPDPPSLHSPELQFLVGCWEVWHALAGPGDQALRRAHGLSLREFIALSHLQAQPTTPARLAQQLGLPRYEVSRLLAQLETLGAVTRNRAERSRAGGDARQVQVGVTPAGHALWSAALEHVQALVRPALAGLGPALPDLGAALLAAAQAARRAPPFPCASSPRRADSLSLSQESFPQESLT